VQDLEDAAAPDADMDFDTESDPGLTQSILLFDMVRLSRAGQGWDSGRTYRNAVWALVMACGMLFLWLYSSVVPSGRTVFISVVDIT